MFCSAAPVAGKEFVMTVLENLRQMLPELSKSERRAADYLLQYPNDVHRATCEGIAESSGSSRSAVIRLCQKLGYRGYAEFRYALRAEPSVPAGSGRDTLQTYLDELQRMQPLAGSPPLLRLAGDILHADHVLALGQLHSGMSARQLAFRLNRFGLDCNALDDVTLMEGYQSVLKPGDVVIIFSISGQNSYRDLILSYRNSGARVALVTMTAQAPIAKLVDEVFLLPRISHASSEYLLDDAIGFFTFVELLIEALHKIRFETKDAPARPDSL